MLTYTNPHRSLPTQKALASFLAKRGNAGMAVAFQIPRVKLARPSRRASLKYPYPHSTSRRLINDGCKQICPALTNGVFLRSTHLR